MQHILYLPSEFIFFVFQVLDALGETIPCAKYDSWMVYAPEAEFLSRIGPTEFLKVISLCFLKRRVISYTLLYYYIRSLPSLH